MNAIAPQPTALPQAAASACFASVTLWNVGSFYIEVHHGYFSTWEAAEDFGAEPGLVLEERAGAVFIRSATGSAFVPDAALQLYRSVDYGPRELDLELDDLLDAIDIGDMRCLAIGHADVVRGAPIQARRSHPGSLAANDAA